MPKKMSTAVKACYHIVNRYRRCPDFANVMQMTESLEMVQTAIAEHEGKEPMTFEERLKDQQNVSHDWKGRVHQLEETVSRLESKLDDAEDIGQVVASAARDESEDRQERLIAEAEVDRVRALMRDAELRGGTVTVEQLADAIAGNHVFF